MPANAGPSSLIEALRAALAGDPRIAYALIFGSMARTGGHAHSDVDVAIGFIDTQAASVTELGDLAARLEMAAGRPVDLVLMDEARRALAIVFSVMAA
jgi:predicted nucleotidyltransferase